MCRLVLLLTPLGCALALPIGCRLLGAALPCDADTDCPRGMACRATTCSPGEG